VDQDGNPVVLDDLYAQGTVLVYFYPKAGTPGCTAQACSLRDAYEQLVDKGVTVVGVSLDNAADQKRFKKENNLPFILIPDVDRKMVDAFGVSHTAGFASREAFLIEDGQIRWHDDSASTAKQAEDVLTQLESLRR
jgi:peroxiredoxin Q/BCP